MTFKAPIEFCQRPRSYTLGADPEFFVMDGDELAPAFAFLPPKGNDRTHFWDGFQAEFIHTQVVTCIGLHGCATHKGLMKLLTLARKQIGEQAKISLVNTIKVPAKMLERAADPHVEFGCMPSENAYNMHGKRIENPREMPWRFAGGHMHFGGFPQSFNRHKALAKALDAVVGVWGVAMAEDLDNPIRREYYGLAGEYRPTKYKAVPFVDSGGGIRYEASAGIEYRTLSNFYFCHPAIHQLAWEVARFAVVFFELGYMDMWAATEDEVIDTINTCNVKQARAILKRNEPMLMWALKSTMFLPIAEKAIAMPYNGVKYHIGRPNDIERNWRLADKENAVYSAFINTLSFKAFVGE